MAALKALQMLDLGRGTFIQKQEIGRPGDFLDWTYEQLYDYVRCEIADLDSGENPPLIGSNWYRRLGTLISLSSVGVTVRGQWNVGFSSPQRTIHWARLLLAKTPVICPASDWLLTKTARLPRSGTDGG